MKQKWEVIIDGGRHSVEYRFCRICGKTTLVVDGDAFTVKGKPFGIGCARREMILVGSEQAVLSVSRKGKAELTVSEAESVTEIK